MAKITKAKKAGAKAKIKRRNADGTLKKKHRNSPKQIQLRREKDLQKLLAFNTKKAEEQQMKDMTAREEALKKLGTVQDFGFADHAKMYNFADDQIVAPIQIIDASVPPPAVTSYPEYPCREFSTPPAFNVQPWLPAPRSSSPTQLHRATGLCRARRAKAILQMHIKASK